MFDGGDHHPLLPFDLPGGAAELAKTNLHARFVR